MKNNTRPRVRGTTPAMDALYRMMIDRDGFASVARRSHWILEGERMPDRRRAA